MLDRTTPPAPGPLADISIPAAREIELTDGMTLTVVRAGDQPLTRLTLVWDGGVADLPPEALTVLSDILTEGAGPYTPEALTDAVDFAGARVSTRLADHYSCISLLGLTDRLPSLYPILKAVATEPLIDAKSVEVARARRATAAAIRLAKVSALASDAAKEAVAGPGHPCARVQTPEAFSAVTRADARAAFDTVWGRGRAGLHAFLTGAVDDRLVDATCTLLGSLPAGDGRPTPIGIRPFAPVGPCRRHIDVPEAVQSAVSIAMPAIPRDHPDYDNLRLTVMALGGYFGSRLMSVVREREGLTYGINASLYGQREGAYMQIDAQCSRENVDRVIEQTSMQIQSLWQQPLRADELERLRLHAWSNLAATADSPLSADSYYQTRLLVGTPADYFERQLRAIASLTPQIVADMARRYLTAAQATVTAGA